MYVTGCGWPDVPVRVLNTGINTYIHTYKYMYLYMYMYTRNENVFNKNRVIWNATKMNRKKCMTFNAMHLHP